MKKGLVMVAVLSMGIVVGVPLVSYGMQKEKKIEQWGSVLATNYEKGKKSDNGVAEYKLALEGQYSQNTEALENVYEAGEDILITKDEVEQAQDYYEIIGDTKKDAKQKAIDHVEEQNALYVEAIKNGFDVTDDEVKAYIEELKKNINNSDNKDEVMEIVNKFDSEEDYWNYEFEVYKKLLPVQKYVKSLEKKYVSKHTKQNGNSDVLEKWDKEFKKIKNKLVDEQNYERVKSDNDIDKEFVK